MLQVVRRVCHCVLHTAMETSHTSRVKTCMGSISTKLRVLSTCQCRSKPARVTVSDSSVVATGHHLNSCHHKKNKWKSLAKGKQSTPTADSIASPLKLHSITSRNASAIAILYMIT